jgi:hypothetical protein
MVWIALGIGLVIAIVIVLALLDRRAGKDLGSMSPHWIAEQRANSPER